mmetsp:Transcript_98470/g.205351  ORF Transcript_98470/g.205351 Transcript_98470/m.205351 type:complete len:328 (+) Transcript_98470:1399-2382(+)
MVVGVLRVIEVQATNLLAMPSSLLLIEVGGALQGRPADPSDTGDGLDASSQSRTEVARCDLVLHRNGGNVVWWPKTDLEPCRCARPRVLLGDGHLQHLSAAQEIASNTFDRIAHSFLQSLVSIQQDWVDALEAEANAEELVARSPNEFTPICWQASTSGDVARPTLSDFSHDVVADDLSLENEQEEGTADLLLDPPGQRSTEVSLHPNLGEERQRGHDQEEQDVHRVPSRQHGCHGLRGCHVACAIAEGSELAIAIRAEDKQPGKDENGHGHRDQELCDVVACVRIVESQGFRQLQAVAQSEHLSCQELLSSAVGKLGEETQDSVET